MNHTELQVRCIAWLARISMDNRVVTAAYGFICDRGILNQPASEGWYDCLDLAEDAVASDDGHELPS